MQKKIMTILAVSALFFAVVEVPAQDVVMNSAETINQGNLKLGVYPTVLFGKNGGDSVWGVAGRFGYGFTPSFDIEVKAAFFKNLTYLGFDAEYWFVKGRNFYASGIAGWHMTNVDVGGDSSGFDLALLLSTRPHTRLELYGAFKVAFDSLKNSDYNYSRPYLVPGIEYRISDDIDLLAEFGFGLNDNARNYASFGLAFYFLSDRD